MLIQELQLCLKIESEQLFSFLDEKGVKRLSTLARPVPSLSTNVATLVPAYEGFKSYKDENVRWLVVAAASDHEHHGMRFHGSVSL